MVNRLPVFPLRFCRPIVSSVVLTILASVGTIASAPWTTQAAAASVTQSSAQPASSKTVQGLWGGEPAYAQSSSQATAISNAEIRSYALSVLDIENIRQQWSSDIATILDVDTLPSIACNDPNSIQGMRRDAREMVVQFCDASIDIVEGHNLSITRFNAITELMNSNEDLRERIQDELLNLQSNAAR